jgi:hypothetical protein
MGGNAQLQPRRADRVHVGLVQIFLPQMQPVAAQLDRQLPIVVHHQNGAMLRAQITRLGQLGAHHVRGLILDPQLDQFHAQGQHPAQPFDVIKDRIKGRQGHRNAFPRTGVEGAAMSRGVIGSA